MRENIEDRIKRMVAEALSERGRKAGLIGGPARAAKLTPERRKAIGEMGAAARWKKAKATDA